MPESRIIADESRLWSAFQQGDIGAFEHIYRTHSSLLIAYGKRLCSDHDLVKDVVQDVFLEIWTRRGNLRDLHTIKYYLFRIVRNKLSKVQSKTAVAVSEDGDFSEHEHLLAPSIEFLITQQESNESQIIRLQKAIAELPNRQREAIMLAFYHDFSNEEIAGIMGINHQSAINHLNRGLTQLRDLFANHPMLALLLALLA